MKLDDESKDLLDETWSKDIVLQPFKRVLQSEEPSLGGSSSSLLYLRDRGSNSQLSQSQWDEAQKNLLDCKVGLEKLIKEGQRLLYLVGNANRSDPLWQPLLLSCFLGRNALPAYFIFVLLRTSCQILHELAHAV